MKMRLLKETDVLRLRRPIGFSLITGDEQIMVARVRRIIPWKTCARGILSLFISVNDLTRVTNTKIQYPRFRLFAMTFNEFAMVTNAGITNPRYRLFFEIPLLFEESEQSGRRLLRFKSRGETVTLTETKISTIT